jgi:hypothetical protein
VPAETRTCPVCWTPFTATGRRIYCSKKCCGTAWERRGRRLRGRAQPAPGPAHATPQPAPQPTAIRGCPHCGQPVTIVALLTTPQAAQPQIPAPRLPGTTPARRARPV